MRPRALIVHTRMPAFDRDSGSQDIDNMIQFLLRAGWQVTFLAREEQGVAEERHADRLRQLGVATHAGFDSAERLVRSNDFDLAIIAFWELAAELLPVLRKQSPETGWSSTPWTSTSCGTRAGRSGRGATLGDSFGGEAAKELNTYNAADAVHRGLRQGARAAGGLPRRQPRHDAPVGRSGGAIARILSTSAVACTSSGTSVTSRTRRPSSTSAPRCCRCSTAACSSNIRSACWATGSTASSSTSTRRRPGVRLIGWVPSVQPYIERSRLAVVPLLHGAGVKRKVIQSMMAGTPVVTTPIGAEGLDLVQGEHALIASDSADLAAGHQPAVDRRCALAPAAGLGRGPRPGTAWPRARRATFRRDRRGGDGVGAAAPARRCRAVAVHWRRRRPRRRRSDDGSRTRAPRGRGARGLRRRRRVARRRLAPVLALSAGSRRRVGRLRPR